jgi:heptosyltransferase-2
MNPAAARLLVRGVNWLCHAVMTTPALGRLREAFPGAHLALLTPAKLAELWRHHPALDSVLTFREGESPFAVARRLRQGNFSIALVLPNSPRSALEVFLARIPQRVGHTRPWRNFLLTRLVRPPADECRMRKRSRREILRRIEAPNRTPFNPPPGAHHIYQYLHLAAALGANPAPLPPQITVADDEVQAVRVRFALPSREGGALIFGLNAGAEYGPAKRWPRDRFVAAAVELQRQTKCHWLIFGGTRDEPLASAIAAEVAAARSGPPGGVRCLAGQTSLRELCAALRMCHLFLTNDSGPMHVAAAVGTPVVVPFGSTSPELTAPGLPGDLRHRLLKASVPCSPCFLRSCPIDFRCMQGISTDAVVTAARQALEAG